VIDVKIIDALNFQNEKLIEPRQPRPDDAEVVGELPLELRQLYTSYIKSAREAELLFLRFTHSDDESERSDLMRQGVAAAELADIMRRVFWFEVREAFNLHDGEEINVAKEWYVWVREGPSASLINEIGDLLKLFGLTDQAR
jgi:hypothetical protein